MNIEKNQFYYNSKCNGDHIVDIKGYVNDEKIYTWKLIVNGIQREEKTFSNFISWNEYNRNFSKAF